jgi:hypothetical protein
VRIRVPGPCIACLKKWLQTETPGKRPDEAQNIRARPGKPRSIAIACKVQGPRAGVTSPGMQGYCYSPAVDLASRWRTRYSENPSFQAAGPGPVVCASI